MWLALLGAAPAALPAQEPPLRIVTSLTTYAAIAREVAGVTTTYTGAYASAQYQLSRRLYLGTRFDWVEPLAVPGQHTWAVVPALTWWQSEWVYLRLEWQHQEDAIAPGTREGAEEPVA